MIEIKECVGDGSTCCPTCFTPYKQEPAVDLRLPTRESEYMTEQSPDWVRERLGLFTDNELASAFEVTTETLKTWRGKNYGPPHVKLGKSVFYRLIDVALWIRDEAEASAAPEAVADAAKSEDVVAVKDPEEVSDGW